MAGKAGMAAFFPLSRRSKARQLSRTGSRSHFIERLETRAYLAAVSITGPAEVNETAGAAQFVVSLSERVASPVTVSYSLQSTLESATYGRDYRLTTGRAQLKPTGTLTFRAGQTSQVITMNVINDDLREGNERVVFALQAARNASLNPAARSLTTTIRDNDNYTVSVVGPAIVQPGTTNEYRLQLSSPATRRETFYVSTRDGSAKVTQDYRPLTRVPVTILPGQSSAIFRLVTVANPAIDYDKTVLIDVVPATPGFPVPSPFVTTIPGPLGPRPPEASITDVTVVEGDAGTSTNVSFVISLNAPWTQPVSINYATADGTATSGSDYTATSGTVTFAPGELSKLVTVTVIGDDTAEADETFLLNLSNPTNVILVRSSATATITNDDGSPEPEFKIDVVFPDNTLTASQKAVFLDAAARWSEIIVGDLPDEFFEGRTIDDLEISATAPAIDGPGQVLGQAGPREFRNGSSLPFFGIMEFDSADVGRMVSQGTFTDVILHEMGHVLGLGTLWDFKDLVQGLGTSNPIYTGANAVKEYQTLSGTTATSVPVENTGGGGTAGGHWRESVFNTEIMTGYAEAPGVPMPISRMTVGALKDLGYTVDYGAADPYSLPVRSGVGSQQPVTPTSTRSMMFLTSGVPSLANVFAAAGSGGFGSMAQSNLTSKAFRAIGSAIRT